jgi:hypothetical protein
MQEFMTLMELLKKLIFFQPYNILATDEVINHA